MNTGQGLGTIMWVQCSMNVWRGLRKREAVKRKKDSGKGREDTCEKCGRNATHHELPACVFPCLSSHMSTAQMVKQSERKGNGSSLFF